MLRRKLSTCVCLLAAAVQLSAQIGQKKEAPAPPPPPPGTTGQKAPPMPEVDKTPSPYDSSDGVISIAPIYWFEDASPQMRTGKGAVLKASPSDLDYPGKAKRAPGGILSLPAGKDNTIRISYFRTTGGGSLTSTKALKFFGTDYDAGTILNPSYTLQNVKISLDYTSWPFPLKTSRFRFKTLWEVQYISMKSVISAPALEAADTTLSPATKTNWFFYPSFGVGIEYSLSKHLRFETQGSGFAFPHRSTLWDASGQLAYRMGPVELFGGGKAFHFRTSPKREEYILDTLSGAFVGIRWYPKF